MNWKQGDVAIVVNLTVCPEYNGKECILLESPIFAKVARYTRTKEYVNDIWVVKIQTEDGSSGRVPVHNLRRKPPPETLGWAKFKVSNLIKTLILKGGSKVVSPTDHA